MDQTNTNQTEKKKCCGSSKYMVYGIIYGAGIGTVLGIAFDTLPIFYSVFPGLGMVLGMVFDRRKKASCKEADQVQ